MLAHTRRTGATLSELTTVFALIAVGLAVAIPPVGSLRDRLAVGAVRNEVMAMILRARAEAPLRGGATVEILVGADEVRFISGDSVFTRLRPRARHGVSVTIGGGRDRAEVAYDVLGLGRVASRTLVFARGQVRDTLRLSSYGRVAR